MLIRKPIALIYHLFDLYVWFVDYQQILERLSGLCVSHCSSGKKNRKHEQRLLRNMGAHTVVLELLQIPYDKVSLRHPRDLVQLEISIVISELLSFHIVTRFG